MKYFTPQLFIRLQNVQLGFDPHNILTFQIALPEDKYPTAAQQGAFFDRLREQLRRYARMRHWHVRLFQAASRIFTPFYQSDSRALPVLRDWLAAPLSRLPIADALLARLVSGEFVAAPFSQLMRKW